MKNEDQFFQLSAPHHLSPGVTIGIIPYPWDASGDKRPVPVLILEDGATSKSLRKAIPELLRRREALRRSKRYVYGQESLGWYQLLHRLGQEDYEGLARSANSDIEYALCQGAGEGYALAVKAVKSWWPRTRHEEIEPSLRKAQGAIAAGKPVRTVTRDDVRDALHRFALGQSTRKPPQPFATWLRQQKELAKFADYLDGEPRDDQPPQLVLVRGVPAPRRSASWP